MLGSEATFALCMSVVTEAKERIAIEDKEERRRMLSSGVKPPVCNFLFFSLSFSCL